MFGKKRKKTSQFSTYRQSGSAWHWILAGAVLIIFATVVGYAYMQRNAVEYYTLDPQLVTAPDAPVKVRAESPGGIKIPNQDKQVFDLLQKVDKKEINEKIPAENLIQKTIMEDLTTPQETEVEVVQETPPPPIRYTDESANYRWGVQLASFANFEDAQNGIARFQTDYYQILHKLRPDLQKARVQGTLYYRTRFIGLESRDAAQNLCLHLKKYNQGCLVVKQ
jgi:cell division protein FtsN